MITLQAILSRIVSNPMLAKFFIKVTKIPVKSNRKIPDYNITVGVCVVSYVKIWLTFLSA